MDRAQKKAEIANLSDKFQRSAALFVADYKGMNVEEMTSVRKNLGPSTDVEMKVVKNTLALRALESQEYKSLLEESLTGTNAIVFAYTDPSQPAKALVKFSKDFEHLKIKAGVLRGKSMSEGQIKALADLPSREVLLAMALGTMMAPVRDFVGVCAAVPRSLVTVLNAVKEKKEQEQ